MNSPILGPDGEFECSRCQEEVDHIITIDNKQVCIDCLTEKEQEERSEKWSDFFNFDD